MIYWLDRTNSFQLLAVQFSSLGVAYEPQHKQTLCSESYLWFRYSKWLRKNIITRCCCFIFSQLLYLPLPYSANLLQCVIQ